MPPRFAEFPLYAFDANHRGATMIEIRVRWRLGLHEDDWGNQTDGGVWFPDVADTRRELDILVEAGNEFMGEGSHWLEERQA